MPKVLYKLAVLIVLLQALLLALAANVHAQNREIIAGWYPWDPYQYETERNEVKRLTGLDVELLKAIFKDMGYDVRFDRVDWGQHQQDIASGIRDVGGGAFINEKRQIYAYYSDPYRTETDVIFVRRGEQSRFDADTATELIENLTNPDIKVGAVQGFYYGPQMMAFLDDPANQERIVLVHSDRENFENLISRKIDAFPIDHLAGATLAWRHGWQSQVQELDTPIFKDNIHAIFSKKSTTPEMVQAFNQSLSKLRESGEYTRIMRDYLLPVLLSATAGQWWFFIVDMIGTVAFAMSGVVLARQGHYSLFGALVLAAVPSVGGGIVRDVLIGRETLSVLSSPVYLMAIISTVMISYLVFRVRFGPSERVTSTDTPRPDQALIGHINSHTAVAFFDALGLAAFAIIGVVVAVEHNVEPLWLWGPLLAAMTGAGGGILRDVIRADVDNPGLKGSFYAEVALIWGLFLSLSLTWYAELTEYNPHHLTALIVFTLIGALSTRMLAFHFKIRSPMF